MKEKYGIKITKPWSKEMYDHNDKVSDMLRELFLAKLSTIKTLEDIKKFGKDVCVYGFGTGFDFDDIYEEVKNEIESKPNYQWHQDWDYYIKEGYIKEPIIDFIGYDK